VAAVQGPRPEVATPAGVGCCGADPGGFFWVGWRVSRGLASGIPAAGPGHGGPRRGYSCPPFEPGNQAHLKHGARSTRHVDPLAAELVEGLLERRPDLADFPEATWAWGRAEARCLLLERWHAEHGFLGPDGEVRGGARVATFEAQAARLRERLGLDPVSDVQLAKAKAEAVALVADLESIRERGRQVLERRRAELATGEDITGEDMSGSEGVPDAG
jgi:hypothetical protein